MLHFIPAWYQQNRWSESEQYWYTARTRTEFDDTVKHIQLFHRSKAYPFRIMLLSYAPNFRHFLHRQSVFHAPYWSCFDAIQEVKRKKIKIFSFHNLNWPDNIEFLYSTYVVIAMLNGEKYAQIEFGEDGNMIQVDIYQNGNIKRRNIYDDRGFVSSTIVYDDNGPLYQDYLTDKGVWKLREYSDGHIEVNQKNNTYYLENKGTGYVRCFSLSSYECMSEVISEVLSEYIKLLGNDDIFCVAMHELNSNILKKVLVDKKKIISFFGDRYNIADNLVDVENIKQAEYIITDSYDNAKLVKKYVDEVGERITDITPFDSRIDFGISQQLNVQKIMVPVDGIEENRLEQLIIKLGEYIETNNNAQIHLFTRMAGYGRRNELFNVTKKYLKKAGKPVEWAVERKKTLNEADILSEMDVIHQRFFVEQCVDELAVSKCIREQRIMVDMRTSRELYLRITGISVGIPQIVYKKNEFVEDGKNGLVLENMDKLPEAIAFYLDSLNNWNESMIYSYELGKKYTTEILIEKWKEVIEFVGRD